MSTLGRRIERLEGARPRPSRFDAMDPILAALSTPELYALIGHGNSVRDGRHPTDEQKAVYGRVREHLAAVGLVLP